LTHGVISLGPQLDAVERELELSIKYLLKVTGGSLSEKAPGAGAVTSMLIV
jgi:hypothetical protein